MSGPLFRLRDRVRVLKDVSPSAPTSGKEGVVHGINLNGAAIPELGIALAVDRRDWLLVKMDDVTLNPFNDGGWFGFPPADLVVVGHDESVL